MRMSKRLWVFLSVAGVLLLLAGTGLLYAQDESPDDNRPLIGITFEPDGFSGLLVATVEPGSAAEAAELVPGDVIVALDGTALTPDNVRDVLDDYELGDTVTLLVVREGESLETELTFGAAGTGEDGLNLFETLSNMRMEERHPRLGVAVDTFDYEDRSGLQVINVVEGSPADEAGIEVGDTITEIDGTPVSSSTELVDLISQKAPGNTVLITVLRDGEPLILETTVQLSSPDVYVVPPSQ